MQKGLLYRAAQGAAGVKRRHVVQAGLRRSKSKGDRTHGNMEAAACEVRFQSAPIKPQVLEQHRAQESVGPATTCAQPPALQLVLPLQPALRPPAGQHA